MKLIIEIPDGLYKEIHNAHNGSIASACILQAAKKGTPLPECHGDLIDKSELLKDRHKAIPVIQVINAPVVVESDKAESEDKE